MNKSSKFEAPPFQSYPWLLVGFLFVFVLTFKNYSKGSMLHPNK